MMPSDEWLREADRSWPPGYTWELGGESESSGDANQLEIEQNGLEPQRAVVVAAERRLTTFTTLGGLLPLYLGGGPMWEPIVLTLGGGSRALLAVPGLRVLSRPTARRPVT